MQRVFVVINESYHDSWSEIIWSDIAEEARVFVDNTDIKGGLVKKLKKLHFSNSVNRWFWIPCKQIWDKRLVIKRDYLNPNDDNFIIFQSNVKFSPQFINDLKNRYNCKIVIYLPDTAARLGIGSNKNEIERYLRYYQVDKVYSFDINDCERYGFAYFDLYSKLDIEVKEEKGDRLKPKILYVGNCRSKKRLELIYSVYRILKDKYDCTFYVNNINAEDIVRDYNIHFNEELSYREVVEMIENTDAILELVNENQIGNTLRFKEAVCYNKYLITNNVNYSNHNYDSADGIITFNNPEELNDLNTMIGKIAPSYLYNSKFSPKKLLECIIQDFSKS